VKSFHNPGLSISFQHQPDFCDQKKAETKKKTETENKIKAKAETVKQAETKARSLAIL